MELKLVEDTIGFGVVTINSKKTKTLQLSNLGDIGKLFFIFLFKISIYMYIIIFLNYVI